MHVYKTVVRNEGYSNRLCDWTNCDNVKVWDAEPPVSKGEVPDWFCDDHKPSADWPAEQDKDARESSELVQWLDNNAKDIMQVFAPNQADNLTLALVKYALCRGYMKGKRSVEV